MQSTVKLAIKPPAGSKHVTYLKGPSKSWLKENPPKIDLEGHQAKKLGSLSHAHHVHGADIRGHANRREGVVLPLLVPCRGASIAQAKEYAFKYGVPSWTRKLLD